MYANYFDRVGLRLPFSNFQIKALNHLRICPSQLHPNAWGFILSFEKLCACHNFFLSLNVFCYFFIPWCGKKSSGYPCLSLKGCTYISILKAFEELIKNFKEMYFWLRPSKDYLEDLFVVVDNESSERFKPYFEFY